MKSLLFLMLLLPAISFCQSVNTPAVGYSEDNTTTINKIEVTATNTVVTFKHVMDNVGAWVELNKSIYLQDALGERKYNYIRSEGIPLRPKKLVADRPNQEVIFKVYFEKLKPGTKEINVIERARSLVEQTSSNHFFNYYNVSLQKSGRATNGVKVTDVVLTSPPPLSITDTAYTSNATAMNSFGANMGPMVAQMYTGMLNAQIKTFSDPAIIEQLARITKSYYDALVKAGFSADAALRIVTSKQLVSTDMGKQ